EHAVKSKCSIEGTEKEDVQGDVQQARILRDRNLLIAAIGRLCEKCDGKCVICDSYVRPCTLVRICDECNYGSYQGRCVICGGPGVSDAYYCKECTIQEKDRDGCPKIVNLGSSKTDLFYERKKYGFKKR
uniref:PHD finger protein 5A n=1 Tax=Astatotilapia calliptera TaxID=8154 RepID=A0AAX7TZ44_ASTCA